MNPAALAEKVRAAAVEVLAGRGLDSTVLPETVDLRRPHNPANGDFADSLRKLMALPRYGAAEEIAGLVAYLAGPEAGFVTGASLAIDGGFTA